jgi:hypothetical protein
MSMDIDQKEDNVEKKKIVKQSLFDIIIKLVNRTHPPLAEKTWPLPKFKIHVLRDNAGVSSFLSENNKKELTYVDFEFLVDNLMKFVKKDCGYRLIKGTSFIEKECRELAKYWKCNTTDFPHPIKPVAEKSDNSYTFRKLDFDFEKCNDFQIDCPAFHEFFHRTSNARAFKAWIGSLFDPNADRQQYVWVYGHGRNGKGSVARILASIFGQATAWEHAPNENERRFWAAGLMGKRLVIFDDCSNYGFVSTGFFKSLTGGSAVRIERKGQTPFSAELNTKFLFLSNDKPLLDGKKADLRRVIFCHSQEPTHDFGPAYEELLRFEAPKMIGHCIDVYKEVTKDRKSIEVDLLEIEDIIDSHEDHFDAIMERNFEVDELLLPSVCLQAHELSTILNREGLKSGYDQRKFKCYLETRHKVYRKTIDVGGKKLRFYENLMAKE